MLLNIKKMDKATKKTRKKYDRFSVVYDFFESGIEKRLFSSWRKKLLQKLEGNILEIGVGTGKNLSYYGRHANVTAIDLSPKMLEKAKTHLKTLDNKNIKLLLMDAQNLKFKDNSFDYVVCTFVLCSVPDPIKALREMKRVAKKNAKLLMLEHVKSKYFIIRMFQYIHNPITRALLGVDINRDTVKSVKDVGLAPKTKDLAFFDVFKKIEIKNKK